MSEVENMSVEQIRAAALTWRAHPRKDRLDSVHDRIDELINEIERLRKIEDRYEDAQSEGMDRLTLD